jgi:hypothetical protein
MRTLQLSPVARARVWFGDCATAFSAAGSINTVVASDPTASIVEPRVTVEAFVPRGGFAEYGLLGMAFAPGIGEKVRVEVPYFEGDAGEWPDALAMRSDPARIGLPRQFARPILEQVAASTGNRFPGGTVRVSEAAHTRVGSNAAFFRRLSTCVLALMKTEGRFEDAAIGLLRDALVGQ